MYTDAHYFIAKNNLSFLHAVLVNKKPLNTHHIKKNNSLILIEKSQHTFIIIAKPIVTLNNLSGCIGYSMMLGDLFFTPL